MAEITAALVKQLREMTDSPMMECKKALVEAEGDIDKAVDVLRTRGIAKSVKKAGRETNEGAVATYICPCGKCAGIAEVKCETDFVSATDKFKALAGKVALAAETEGLADVEALKAVEVEGTTVETMIQEAIMTIGENITIGRFDRLAVENGAISSYIHMGGKMGVLVAFGFEKPETAEAPEFKTMAHDVAMQVAAAKPLCAVREDMEQSVIDHEMTIYRSQAAESGKPEAIQEKMALGRLEKFFKENTLVDQEFVKDPEKTISQYIAETSKQVGDKIEVKSFKLFVLGE